MLKGKLVLNQETLWRLTETNGINTRIEPNYSGTQDPDLCSENFTCPMSLNTCA